MKYGKLTVLDKEGRYFFVRCDCGVEKKVRMDHLKSGATISCGCVGKKNSREAKTTHGMSHTRVFKIWEGVLYRCRNKVKNYGKRGISVCDRWNDFKNFYEDMGDPPSKQHSIDRIDVNGDYFKDNCRWATQKQQARNKRSNTILNHDGKSLTIAEWSEITGIKQSTICVRLSKGWSVEKTLTKPVKNTKIGKPHPDTGSIVVLTVAHIRHDKQDCRFYWFMYIPGDPNNNLVAECQRCHLWRDRKLHARNRKYGRKHNRKEQLRIFKQ